MRIAIDCNGRKYMTSEPDRTSPTPLFNAFVKEQVEKEQMAQAGITDSGSWHNGYRAACKDICERFGLENTDEIELLVKDQQLFQAFQGDVNELRDQIAKLERENTRLDIKSCIVDDMSESIDRLKAELAEARKVVDAAKNLANVKGRHNSEIAMKRLIEAMQGKDE